MAALLKLLFVVGPLAAQAVIDASGAMGVTHGTWAQRIAGWVLALTLSGRAVVAQQNKNVAMGTGTAGGGA